MSRTTWVSQYQKKHSPTHIYLGHQSFLICFIHLLQFVASSLFNPRSWQSFSTISFEVFFGLPLGLALSNSYSVHFFIQSLSSFCSTWPYHHNLFRCSTEIMLSNSSLCFKPLLRIVSCIWQNHSHLYPLKCHLIFLSYRPGRTFMQHTTLHTTVVQPPSHFQWNILIGKEWYQLPEFIPSSSHSVLHTCFRISIHTEH